MFKRISFASALLASTALMAGAASAADIIAEEPAPLFSWSGFYLGLNAGVAWGFDHDSGCKAYKDITGEHGGPPTFESAESIEQIEDNGYWEWPSGNDGSGCFDAQLDDGPHEGAIARAFNLDGDFVAVDDDQNDDNANFLAGGQIGINQQYGAWVIGLEADADGVFGDDGVSHEFDYFHSADFYDGCDSSETYVCLDNYQGTGKVKGGDIDWIATFRARLGFAAGAEGRLLLYGTGGVALAGVNGLSGKFDDSGLGWCDGGCEFNSTDDHIEVGFAAGAGFEWAWTDSVSFGLEYLFLGFGDGDNKKLTFYGDDGRSFSFDDEIDDMNVVRAKLNFRFPPPG